jgi:tripartite ATP-independent transporter DctP family solute receptor
MRWLWLSVVVPVLMGPAAAQTQTQGQTFLAANVHQSNYPSVQALAYMAQLVDERAEGRVHIKVVSQSRGSEPFTVEQVRSGKVALAAVNIAQLSNFVPETAAFALPFLFNSADHIWRTVHGPVGEEIFAALDRQGFVGLAVYDAGDRSFFTANKPIRKAADLSGMKVRVQNSPLALAMIRATGATPVPTFYETMFDALKTGVVDAAEDSWPAFVSSRLYEVANVYSVTRHSRTPEVLIFSKLLWQELSAKDREIVREAALQSVHYHSKLRHEAQDAQLQAANTLGVRIVDDVDRQSFREAMDLLSRPLVAAPSVVDLVERIRALDHEEAEKARR